MGTRFFSRCALGVMAVGVAVWPIALPATVGAAEGDAFGPGIDYQVDPPDTYTDVNGNEQPFGEFTPVQPLLTDGWAETLGNAADTQPLIDALTGGVGIPDIAPGEPGDLDLPPGRRVIDIQAFGPDDNGDGLPDQAEITLGSGGDEGTTATITADAAVETLGGGNSFLQGHCAGVAVSYEEDGSVLDAATGIGASGDGLLLDIWEGGEGQRAFTKNNPFKVSPAGKVVYFGFLPYGGGDGPRNHVWEITTAGISVDSGGDDNPDGNNANAGIVDLGGDIPAAARFTGVFPVQGWFFSQNGLFCVAEGWVEFTGPFPLFTTPGAVAALLGLGGIAGLLFNSRPAQTFKA